MTDFIQLVFSGLATGAIYALAAIGFTLLWQTTQTINFAQGEFVMVPAFFVLGGMTALGLPFPLAGLLGVAITLAVLGLAFKYLIVDPLIGRKGTLPLVISTIAVALLLKDGAKEFYSAEGQPFPTVLPRDVYDIFGVKISLDQVGVLLIAVGSILALQYFLSSTRTGRQMQAVAQNPTTARILGVPVERMILYTFLINALLAALASVLISPAQYAKFSNGEAIGLSAFIAAIIGGFNQVRGAIVGGLLIGVLDNLAARYVSSAYRLAVPLALLVLVILFRPQGLLGRKEERAV